MEDPALSVFSEARHEYMKQLSQYLRQPFLTFFVEQLSIAREEMRDTPKRYLWQFQNRLRAIKEWNVDKVQNEINRIQIASNCDFLEELITAIFIAHTKVMTAIRISSKKSKVNITVPKLEHYLFRAVCECSDLLWANAFLFRDDISPIDKQKNMRQVESLVLEGMQQAIRSLLPLKTILRDLVTQDDEEDASSNDASANISEEHDANISLSESDNQVKEEVVEPVQEVVEPLQEESTLELPVAESNEPVKDENVRHFEHTKNASPPSSMQVNKLSAEDSGCSKPTDEIIELTGQSMEEFIPDIEEPVIVPIPVSIPEPTILQIDTAKQVKFSDYNMGFTDNDDTDAYFESAEDRGIVVIDGTESAIDDSEFDTL